MTRISLSTGRIIFIGEPTDGFILADYRPQSSAVQDGKPVIVPSSFYMGCPGKEFINLSGKEADEFCAKLSQL